MRYISTRDRKYYSFMLEIIETLGRNISKYKWLITDMEVSGSAKIFDLISQNKAVILSTNKLFEYLQEDDFQWIWAVFSAIPETVSDEEILKCPLPYARENNEIYKDDLAIIQHPLAEIEIVAEDSSSVFIVSDREEILNSFKKIFPNCRQNY